MLKTSEWVSLGHSDKIADYIVSFILDRYLEKDPMTRYAMECQIKGKFVTLGGEVTSKAQFSADDIAAFVRVAVNQIGYTKSYQWEWKPENTICGDELEVTQHISAQSPDIARGVDAGGWTDNGLCFGMAVNSPETNYMPRDWWLARAVGKHLYDIRYAGIDLKTMVTLDDGKVKEVVVSIPMNHRHFDYDIKTAVKGICGRDHEYPIRINGTGKFVQHGPIADCGTTGRKLAVDFYGSGCKIGGGAINGKDPTKADLSLNLLARACALSYIKHHPDCPEVHCAISCRIGSPEILVVYFDEHMNQLESCRENVSPEEVINQFSLREPKYAKLCRDGLFSCL